MTSPSSKLPLHSFHASSGAKFGLFGEWEVPLYYTSILEEHQHVRNQVGVFDISHMGEFIVKGKSAEKFLDQLLPRNIAKLKPFRAWYSPLLNDQAGFVDDIIVYKVSSEFFWIIVNAGNVAKDFAWFKSHLIEDVELIDETPNKGLLAVQGPQSVELMQQIFPSLPTAALPNYSFLEIPDGLIARTGYTGEDGFEIMVPKEELESLWQKLFQFKSLKPIGFGARDTLRLEAAMPLYGHDMDDSRNPIEAGLAWAVDFTKQDFLSKSILESKAKSGTAQKLVGFEMLDRGIPRQGYAIQKEGNKIGEVTSGSFSPTFQKNIGLAYVDSKFSSQDAEIDILVRDKPQKAKIVKLPFYRRKK